MTNGVGESLTISLLRPDDLLVLAVEVTNMRLDTSDPSIRGWCAPRPRNPRC